jgi:hypothetical protein
MLPHEGAAVRIQLDAMISALGDFGDKASSTGDGSVFQLLESLYVARDVALKIEKRGEVMRTR